MVKQIIPMLAFQDASKAIDFYKSAFDAIETMRMEESGKILHAEIRIGPVDIMIADEVPEINVYSPATAGACPIMLLLVTDEVEGMFDKAVSNGATVDRPVTQQLDGQIRNGKIIDPFGYKWMISSRPN